MNKFLKFFIVLSVLFVVSIFSHNVFATVGYFYPDAHPETNTVDGLILSAKSGNGCNQESWDVAHDATDEPQVVSWDGDGDNSTILECGHGYSENEETFAIYRPILLFDTSGLSDDAIITSAKISFYLTRVDDAAIENTDSVVVVSSNPASNTALDPDDIDTLGNTDLSARLTYGNMNLNAYNDLILNATGIVAISKTGITKFGIRSNWDIDDIFLDYYGDGGSYNKFFTFSSAETINKPTLIITYTTASSISAYKTINGIVLSAVKTINNILMSLIKFVNNI